MKYIAALTCLLLAAIAAPAYAHEPANTCADRAQKVAPAEREAFTKKCLADSSTPEKVAKAKQHDKEHHCNTNAESMKLEGKKKTEYLEHCYHEDDFKGTQKTHPKN